MITFFNVFHTAPARPPLGTPISDWRDVKSSKPPVFILLRTLPHHGQHPTPFLSITSTLFLSRRGMPPLFPFWNSPPTQHSAVFSTTYAVPILQVLLFDIHPSNGGAYPPGGSTPHCKTRSMSTESTSTAADRAIRSSDSTTRKVFFFRTRFPSTPASGPLLMRTRAPTL